MPAITKRKKTAPILQKNTLHKFGKITKSQPAKAALLKEIELREDTHKINLPTPNKQKRKAGAPDEHQVLDSSAVSPAPPTTPRKKARIVKSNVTETPTRGARSLFQAFSIGTFESKADVAQLPTPPPSQDLESSQELPKELKQLTDLHSCFLTALSLHIAHNGRLTPVDLRELCPTVAKTWRLRKVEQMDVQRLLHLQNRAENREGVLNTFLLTDYNHGKICIELVEDGNQHRAIDEKSLNAQFSYHLRKAWTDFARNDSTCSVLDFIANLPLAHIKPLSSISKAATSLSKGQQRLAELKAGAIKAQERTSSISLDSAAATEKPKRKDPFERSMDLKSRIFAKQQQNAGLPKALTPDQIAHRSALMRLNEIAPVLESLALGRQRHRNDDAGDDPFNSVATHVTFTLPTLVQNMQMSLRNPIDRNECEKCLRLLAEIAQEWIGVRMIGTVLGVTVRSQGIGKFVLARRIEEALTKV